MSGEPVEGAIFARNYLQEPFPLEDSMRARRRVLEVFRSYEKPIGTVFVTQVRRELGIDYPFIGMGFDDERHWCHCETRDFLGSITLFLQCIRTLQPVLDELRRIFAEESLRYRIDDKGGVHPLVDEEFEREVATTIAGLGQRRFAGARHALEQALDQLGPVNPSGKHLLRSVFECVETTFLVWANDEGVNRLNAQAIDEHLLPYLRDRYANDVASADYVTRIIDTMKKWVHSVHPFRHGANIESIHECPMDLAIVLATQGFGFARLVAGLDLDK